MISIKNLYVSINDKEILHDINLDINDNEIFVLMGPNGSGKSTLANAIMNYPDYKKKGSIIFNGNEIINKPTNEIAKLGIYMSFQNPVEIEGLGTLSLLNNIYTPIASFKDKLNEIYKYANTLQISRDMLNRSFNYGFSGGEKKRIEILQMFLMKPKFAILDEPDSGLDVDSLKIIANAIESYRKDYHIGMMLITHYSRITKYIKVDRVGIMYNGYLAKVGSNDLIEEVEAHGYDFVVK